MGAWRAVVALRRRGRAKGTATRGSGCTRAQAAARRGACLRAAAAACSSARAATLHGGSVHCMPLEASRARVETSAVSSLARQRPAAQQAAPRRTSYYQLTRARCPGRVNLVCARCPEPRVHFRVSHRSRQPACQGRRAAMSSKVSARLSCALLCAAAAHSSPCNARALAFRCGCCTRVRTLVGRPLRSLALRADARPALFHRRRTHCHGP